MLMSCSLGISAQTNSQADEKIDGLFMKLISDHSAIQAGRPFMLGIHIQHKEGFHSYWKNPGLVGLATSLKWNTPLGFIVSEVQWPHPEISSMAGNPCYAYKRDVTLYVSVTPPKKIDKTELVFSVDAAWMCCSKNCFPGNKTFNIELPVSSEAELCKSSAPLFSLAKKQIPKNHEDLQVQILSGSAEPGIRLNTFIPKFESLDEIYLFSEDGQISSAENQIIKKESNGSLTITAKRCEFSPEKQKTLPAILKSGDSYYQINPFYTK